MYKNMSVGAKIGLGFGIVIVLLAVSTFFSVFTSSYHATNLATVNELQDLQMEANLLLDSFNEARVQAKEIFNTLDVRDNYDACVAALAESEGHLQQMRQIADRQQLDLSLIEALENDLVGWHTAVQTAYVNNLVMTENRERIITTTDALINTSNDVSQAIGRQIARGEADDLSAEIGGSLLPCISLSQEIQTLRIYTAFVVLDLDASWVPAVEESYEAISAQTAQLAASDRSNYAGLFQATQQQLLKYREVFDLFLDSLLTMEQSIISADIYMTEIVGNITAYTQELNQSTGQSLDSAIANRHLANLMQIALAVIALILAALTAIRITRGIHHPLTKIKQMLNQVGGTGDLSFPADFRADLEKSALYQDEVGQSIYSSLLLIRRIEYLSGCLEKIARGDFSVEIQQLSARDTIGDSLNTMIHQLNQMFEEICHTSQQVAEGSTMVNEGSHILAQGAHQQAASMQQISASISQISSQSANGIQTVQESAELGENIRTAALESNQQMQLLTKAVKEINQASRNIESVLKDIENIAYQTNILALNASVEAARAGHYGRGFAVVAEQVRQLAQNSTAAAQKTADLIAANIDKAALGLSITNDTAQSLYKIVQQIQESSNGLQTIARQSAEINQATQEVSSAIEQVANVVQVNSATGQQSAATSEEMNRQASYLQELLSHIRLKNVCRADLALIEADRNQ